MSCVAGSSNLRVEDIIMPMPFGLRGRRHISEFETITATIVMDDDY